MLDLLLGPSGGPVRPHDWAREKPTLVLLDSWRKAAMLATYKEHWCRQTSSISWS